MIRFASWRVVTRLFFASAMLALSVAAYAQEATITGTITEYAQKETGSWFAHSRDDRLWLDRLVLRKQDGEITTLILDDYSHVEIEAAAEVAKESV